MTDMDEKRSNALIPRQSRVIAVLVQARNIEDGAKRAGVSKTTVYKWMRITSFREELTRRKNEVMDVTLEDLKTHVQKAAEVLGALLSSDSEANLRR